MAKRDKQTKSTAGYLLKIDREQGIVDAIVSVFGVVDDGDDRIWPGSYTKTIQERGGRIRPLDMHNTDSILRVLGKVIEIREVGREELPEKLLSKFPTATGGLFTSTQYLLDTPEGSGAFKRISSGAIDEYSIGYEALDFDFTTEEIDGQKKRIRNIRTIRLWEYSAVIWGMNEATTTTGVKESEDSQEVNVDKENVDGENKKSGKTVSDDLFGYLVLESTYKITSLYSKGLLDSDQFSKLLGIATTHMKSFSEAIPEEIAMLPSQNSDMYYMGSRHEQEVKETDEKKEEDTTDDAGTDKAGPPDDEEKDVSAPTDKIEALLSRAKNIG